MSGFIRTQKQLADHLRDPLQHQPPENIEDRRLKIYRDLIYRNIEGFLSGGFPILRSILADDYWHDMVRDFVAHHRSHSPYFLEISQEFLAYLREERKPHSDDPAFMQELAHYEWVELALDVSEERLPVSGSEVLTEDLLTQHPVVSPLAWCLSYQYPVHLLGPNFQPEEAPSEATFLIVYRNRQDEVQFMASNALTVHLLNLLNGDESLSGEQALLQLAEELGHPNPSELVKNGLNLLSKLQYCDIIF